MGTGRALLRATTTLVLAEEIWGEAKAPVRARAATAVRTMSFMDLSLLNLCFELGLAGHSAASGAVRWAHGHGESAVAGDDDLGACGGDLGGGKSTGEGKGGDGGTNDELYGFIPFKSVFWTWFSGPFRSQWGCPVGTW